MFQSLRPLLRCSVSTICRPRPTSKLSTMPRVVNPDVQAGPRAKSSPSTIFPAEEPQFSRFSSRRSVVHSTKGIVACTQPLAGQAGVKILSQGGNAADAAVAAAAALNVTEPASTGIGGDMFCLFYDAHLKKTFALNGSGRAGSNATLSHMLKIEKELGTIPFDSVHNITVPGSAAGWIDAVEKFGSGKLSMETILGPAIELAENGFPVSELSSSLWQQSSFKIRNASPNFAELLKPDLNAKSGVRAPRPGEVFKSPNLAKTFRSLAKHGKKGFYEGEVAEEIVKVVKELGSDHLTLEDLKRHGELGSEAVEGISIKFSGQNIRNPIELWEHPPNGQGLIALMALGMFEELEKAGKIKTFTQDEHNSPEYLHALIEVLRLAFSDGAFYIGDPNTVKVPVDNLISSPYLAERVSRFSPTSTMSIITPGSPVFSKSDTVYLSVTDPAGNAMSFINSNYGGFGTAIVPKGCGFSLHNRGSNFCLIEGHPNCIAPNKRPYHTIIPAMVTNPADGSLNTVYGVMGGFMQPQGHVQVLLNMLVFGMNPQEALDAPRICIEPAGSDGKSSAEGEVYLESGIGEDISSALKKLGHNCFILEGYDRAMFGRGQVIRRSQDGDQLVWSAGSDLRGDGGAYPL